LHRFKINTIKIDQAFVHEIDNDQGYFPVVLAIISIARGLGLNVVAEGVESEVQVNYLKQNGCNVMQGYYFSHPIKGRDFVKLLANSVPQLAWVQPPLLSSDISCSANKV
jgi:EAL domain-containing protein (putative c-di-GMP-specific phosphodiesterase class I)